jgi:hypothetical protein
MTIPPRFMRSPANEPQMLTRVVGRLFAENPDLEQSRTSHDPERKFWNLELVWGKSNNALASNKRVSYKIAESMLANMTDPYQLTKWISLAPDGGVTFEPGKPVYLPTPPSRWARVCAWFRGRTDDPRTAIDIVEEKRFDLGED